MRAKVKGQKPCQGDDDAEIGHEVELAEHVHLVEGSEGSSQDHLPVVETRHYEVRDEQGVQ